MSELLATWWRQGSDGTYYWRCKVPAAALPGRVNWLDESDLKSRSKIALAKDLVVHDGFYFPRQSGDTAIWQFVGDSGKARLMAKQQQLGYRVLMEVDDNYLMPSPIMHRGWVERFTGPGDDEDVHSLAAHREIARMVDGLIVATDRLAEEYDEVNENIYVCRNSLAVGDWPVPLERDDGILRIGWAASGYHVIDADIPRRAMEWASRQRDVEVYLVGLQPKWRGDFIRVPWQNDLKAYRHSLAELRLDVGICPLVQSPWSDCKSDVKALEYAVTGALPVVSRVEPYRDWWDGNLPALSCEVNTDWGEQLRWCVEHRDEVRAMGARAREYVITERSIERSIGSWHRAIQGGDHGEAEVRSEAEGGEDRRREGRRVARPGASRPAG